MGNTAWTTDQYTYLAAANASADGYKYFAPAGVPNTYGNAINNLDPHSYGDSFGNADADKQCHADAHTNGYGCSGWSGAFRGLCGRATDYRRCVPTR